MSFDDLVLDIRTANSFGWYEARRHRDRLRQWRTWRSPADARFLMSVGENLFRLAFPEPENVAGFVDRFVDAVASNVTLRVRLKMSDPEIASMPWEFLCLPQKVVDKCAGRGMTIRKFQPFTTLPDDLTFLGLRPHVSVVREAGAAPDRPEKIPRSGRLRILVAYGVALQDEAMAVSKLLDQCRQRVEWSVMPNGIRSDVERRIREFQPDFIHSIGTDCLPASTESGIPVIVLAGSDSFPIFYSGLLAGRSLDQCVHEVRRQIVGRAAHGNGTPEWGLPLLYVPPQGSERCGMLRDELGRRFHAVLRTARQLVPTEMIFTVSGISKKEVSSGTPTELSLEDLADGHRRWAGYCRDWRNLEGFARSYALRHLAGHLLEVAKTEPP